QELDRSPRHGYQVVLEIEARSGGYFQFSHGTLYPILHRLEKEGPVAARWSDPAKGRPRKECALTAAGRTSLAGLSAEWRELRDQLEPFLDAGERDHASVRPRTA